VRFQNVAIPQGAMILQAYLTFTADETSSSAIDLTFWGEASDNAGTFTTATGNLSNRPTTVESVAWNDVPAWNAVGEEHQSPDLSAVIEEIVGRPGWEAGNALVLLVTGTGPGKRAAGAWDGVVSPVELHVEYGGAATGY
jgi:hypothetical protein